MTVLVSLGCRADGPSELAQFVVSGAAERNDRAWEAPVEEQVPQDLLFLVWVMLAMQLGIPPASVDFARVAWSGPYMVDGRVVRPTAIPKVALFYGIPAIAACVRDLQNNFRVTFHLTFSDVKKALLDGNVEIVFSAADVSKFMRQRAQLASEHGMFHDDEFADHERWLHHLAVVLRILGNLF
jgi:hypothetical protein